MTIGNAFLVISLLSWITKCVICFQYSSTSITPRNNPYHVTRTPSQSLTDRQHNNLQRTTDLSCRMVANGVNSIQVALEDFPQIIRAIELFQVFYHQKKIPSSFVVPEFEEWPSELQGFRLGKRLEKILSTKSFFTQYPDKVKQLSAVFGLENNLSLQTVLTDDWFIVYDALKTYFKLYGDVKIPPNFVVPREDPWPKLSYDLKLGLRVSAIRNVGRYVKDYPSRREQLDGLGFDWRGRDQIRNHEEEQLFQKICQALTIYKQLFQSVVIPVNYVIPPKMKEFPAALRGLPLGKYISQIKYENKLISGHPERVNQLHSLGIHLKYDEPSAETEEHRQKEAQLISLALKEYRKQYGRTPIPRSFIVPKELPWPRETWDMPLGEKVAEINANAAMIASAPRKNRRKIGSDYLDGFVDPSADSAGFGRSKLTDFIEDQEEDRQRGYNERYSDEDEEDELENEFPKDEDEDGALSSITATNGASSASATNRRRHPDSNPRIEPEIERFNPFKINGLSPYREMAAEAFNRFEEDYIDSGNPRERRFRVFQNFLGINELNKMLYKTPPPEQIAFMRKMKHRMLEFDQFYWDDVLIALKLYKQVHQHLDVSPNFVVDERLISKVSNKKDRRQYQDLIGMKLGDFVQDLRVGDVDGFEDPVRRKILDDLGFTWGDPLKYLRFRFAPMASALQMMFIYYGTTTLDEDFIIPDNGLWPEWMVDMELGKWCAIAKIQQNVLRRYYPHRHQILTDMGFLWWTGFQTYYSEYSVPPV